MNKRNRFIIFIFFIFIITFALTGCNLDSLTGTNLETTKKGSINGVIVNKTDEALTGVEISINDKTTTTNSKGLFNIEDLEVGTYTLVISLEGYQTKIIDIEIENSSNNLGTITLVKENEKYSLTVDILGNGKITKTPDNDLYEKDSQIELRVSDIDNDWEFYKWIINNREESNNQKISLKMDENKTIKAIFGEILIKDDFSNNNSGWKIYSNNEYGTYQNYNDGKYEMRSLMGYVVHASPPVNTPTSYNIKVNYEVIKGDIPIFGFTFNIENYENYYMFKINYEEKIWAIQKKENGQRDYIINWTPLDLITNNNTIKMTKINNNYKFYVNKEFITDIELSELNTGAHPGLFVFEGDQGVNEIPTAIYFDDFEMIDLPIE